MADRRRSLRRRLISLIMAGTGAVWLAATLFTYEEARHHAEELFDAQLAEYTEVLSTVAGHEAHEMEGAVTLIDHPYGRTLTYQVYSTKGELLMRSHAAPEAPLAAHDGYSRLEDGDERWRVYRHTDPAQAIVVIAAHRQKERAELAGDIALRLVLPLLLGLPLIGAAVWFAVSRALAPLNALAQEVGAREASHLSPVDPDEAPREVMPLVEELNRLFERLERSFASERSFTGDAAHELRTPLAAIKTQAEVALSTANDERRRRALEQVVAGVQRATALVEQLLALARLDAFNEGRRETVDLAGIVGDTARELAVSMPGRRVEIVTAANELHLVEGDGVLLHMLARNLVDNALRYSPPDAAVRVSLARERDTVRFDVEDAGPGVEPELRQRIFDRFFRVPGVQPGSGLGLSIARRIVELHDGTIEAGKSEPLGGLRVTVILPASLKQALSAAA
ncbi:MAG TPA: ATP-binding protein [Usitatibacter sp.]|nr:ATP-binding protein [Usitatibacter sp.]